MYILYSGIDTIVVVSVLFNWLCSVGLLYVFVLVGLRWSTRVIIWAFSGTIGSY